MCYLAMHEPGPRSTGKKRACASLASPAEGWPQHQIAEALGGQRRRRQPMAETGSARRPAGSPPSPPAVRPPIGVGPASASADLLHSGPSPMASAANVDPETHGGGDPCGV